MKTQQSKMADTQGTARSVLECGDLSPLFLPGDLSPGAARQGAQQESADKSAHSKTWRTALLPVVCFIILHSSFCLRAWGQYSIDWSTIDGGGGATSTGGVYSVSGTIGQPDAGKMSGGNYTVDGGFWGIIAVISSPVPTLTIRPSGANVIVCWPSPSNGFVLEQNPTLDSGGWTAVATMPSDDGTTKCVTLPAGPGIKFYRLKNP